VFPSDVSSVKIAKLVEAITDTFEAKKQKIHHGRDCTLIFLDHILSNAKEKNRYDFGVKQ
jgi:hypothetical protein